MAYVGKQPVRGQNRELDDISGSFNGSNTAFTMQVGGVNTSAGSVNQLFISVGGVMQNPGTDFTAAASTLTFTTAPPDGASFWGLIQGDSVNINTPADDSVTGAKLAVSLVAGDTLYASGADTLARLPKGTDGQVLKLASGVPSWAADAQDSTLTTQGDILYRGGSGYARLPAGTNGHFLKTQGSGANPAWAAGGVTSDARDNTVAGTYAGQNLDNSNSLSNTLIGKTAGQAMVTPQYNTAVGFAALVGDGSNNVTGGNNVAVGAHALRDTTSGQKNVAVGRNAGLSMESAIECTFVGHEAGNAVTTGNYNTCVGAFAGHDINTGTNNVVIGTYAGDAMTTGGGNTIIGYNAFGASTGNGNQNVCIGENAGSTLDADSENVFVGWEAGKNLAKYGNTCLGFEAGISWSHADNDYEECAIGRQAGKNQSGGWGQLYIAHRDHAPGAAAVWIYGSDGGACTQGNNSSSWTTTSDQRLKKNIVDNNVGLVAIDQLQVRNFEYKTEDEIDRTQFTNVAQGKWTQSDEDAGLGTKDEWKQKMSLGHSGTQIGLIAQELEAVLPECVSTDVRGVKTVDTDEIMWHMLTAIKELSTKVKALEAA